MLKIINIKINNISNIYMFILRTFFVIGIIGCIYLVFYEPRIILYSMYISIIILGLLLHILVIKNFNFKFDDLVIKKNNNFFAFLLKIFFLQFRIYLLVTWLLANLLSQGVFNSKFTDIFSNLFPEHYFAMLINGIVNWVVFVSLLLGIGFYKYRFKFSNLRIAKFLLPNASTQPSIFFYNSLLGVESYIRIMSFIILLIVLLAGFFEIIAAKYKFFSFLNYPMITSFVVFIVYSCARKKLEKSIDFFCNKQSMDFIKIFTIVFSISSIIIFVINQFLLSQIEFLKIIPQNILTTNSSIITRLFHDPILNKERLKILFISLNVMLTFGATSDIFVKHIAGCKIWAIYVTSCFFPIIYTILCYKFDFSIVLNNLLTTNGANCLMLLVIIGIFKLNYKDIHHILCIFGLKPSVDGQRSSIKMGFSLVVKSIITMSFLCLSAYYVFAWILVEHIVGLGALLILPIIAMLIIKILCCFRNLTADLTVAGQRI